MSPDVSRYSVADIPQHGSALTAGLGNYLAVPVFEPLSNEYAGVLEIIGDKKGSFSQDLVHMVHGMLNKVDLRSSNMYGHPDKKGLRGLERALKEIEEQLNFICRTHQLPLAQTWLHILDGSNVERFKTTEEQFCICTSAGYEFRAACDMFHLGKSQGVVGKAFLTRSSCFCSDITQLSMTEYPLAHVAHRVGLHSSFAICLQSSYTGDYVYLLEFFLPQDNKSDCRSPQTILNMLLVSMKRQFRSFKLASGQKLGEKLSVEVIPVPSDDGLESFEICHSGKPISDIEAVARPEKILWFNPLNRLLQSGNTVNLCPENVDVTTSSRTANTTTNLTNNVRLQTNRAVEEESMMKISERQYRINCTVLQQSVGAKIYGSETTLASQSARDNLGTEHLEVSDMSSSSDQLEYAKDADIYFKETSGGEYEEQQIISKEGGSLLKDNFKGGASWACEVGSQSMVCPIIVEDLNRPRQMRVEMLCEEPVLFVEIANIIIGIGLTILKWAMETRNDKTWVGFIVEANRDVKRIEILYSLIRLLEHIGKLEENLLMSLRMT
ncbi:PREDICTED: protein NLP7-like isoform X2 [Nicotiana attenuata]|uniref:protein NLP7-like isoform X2 n=1 Tax=Nicotiana attenuata TaxID=49451 RepID=UPI000904AA9D|nr:PREDICTED: protein NLP7-like isoform X2 [Nicotiana attenuata]